MNARPLCLALLVLLLPVVARADRHKIGFRGAGVYAGRSELWGLQISFDVPFHGESKEDPTCPPEAGKPKVNLGTWSAILEVSLVSGIHKGEPLSQYTSLGGLRYSLNRIGQKRKVQPFAQALLGRAEERLGVQPSALSLAGAFGGGVDIPFGSVADNGHPWSAIRVQADAYWQRAHPTVWYPQVSVGFVVRVAHAPKCCPPKLPKP